MAVTLTTSYQKLGEVLIGNAGYGNIYFRLYARYTEQMESSNSSKVQYQLRHYVPSGAGFVKYASSSQKFSGDISTSTTNSANQTFNEGEKTLLTATKTINHEEDGSKTISVGASFTNSYFGNTVKINSIEAILPTIPRATTPTLENTSYEFGEAITIELPRVVSNFTHKLYFQIGNSAKTEIADNVGTSYDWENNLYLINWLPNNTSGTVTIYCQTYNGETFIGEKSVTFIGNVPSSIVPSIDTFTVEEYVSDVANKVGVYLKGKSQLSINVSASGDYASTISSYRISANEEIFSSSSAITSVLKKSGVQMVSVTVTDSRGRTSTKGLSIRVVDYFLPQANSLTVYRCDGNGNLKDDGVYVKAILNFKIAPVENLNTKKVEIQYYNDSIWKTLVTITNSYVEEYVSHVITSQEFSVDNAYKFRMLVTDYFSSDEWVDSLPTSFTLINFHQSGKAIGFGGVAQREEGFEFKLPIYDEFDTKITNGVAITDGERDPDTTLETDIICAYDKSPTGNPMYVHTIFYGEKRENQHCVQFAFPYYEDSAIYYRYRFSQTWSAWFQIANVTS